MGGDIGGSRARKKKDWFGSTCEKRGGIGEYGRLT